MISSADIAAEAKRVTDECDAIETIAEELTDQLDGLSESARGSLDTLQQHIQDADAKLQVDESEAYRGMASHRGAVSKLDTQIEEVGQMLHQLLFDQ